VTSQLQDEVHLKSGRITLAVMETLIVTIVPDLLTAFQKRHPGIFVVLQDLLSDAVVDSVRSGAADIGLVSWFPARRDIRFEPLLRDEVLVVVGRTHPLAARRAVTLTDIADQPLLLPPRGTGFREFIEGVFIRAGLSLLTEREVQSLPAHIALTAAGHGISMIPASSRWLADLSECRLLHIRPHPVQRIVGMATAKNRSPSPAAQAFQSLIRERLAEHPDYIGGEASERVESMAFGDHG
jgi:DNA-binding transcriptional LysR family regulator